jgi:hypothetical protein
LPLGLDGILKSAVSHLVRRQALCKEIGAQAQQELADDSHQFLSPSILGELDGG